MYSNNSSVVLVKLFYEISIVLYDVNTVHSQVRYYYIFVQQVPPKNNNLQNYGFTFSCYYLLKLQLWYCCLTEICDLTYPARWQTPPHLKIMTAAQLWALWRQDKNYLSIQNE
jgi:hypothetical protein